MNFEAVAPIENEDDRVWESMCLKCDKEAVVFISTLSVIGGVILFCCYQLSNLTDCHSQNAYMGLLGTSLGVFLPSPSMRK